MAQLIDDVAPAAARCSINRSGSCSAALILCAAGILSGCSNVEVAGGQHLNGQALSGEGRTIAHLNASSWGIYLFNWIPLISGSRETPERCSFFRDTATVEDTVALLTKKASELGANRTTELHSLADSWWQGWSLIFWMRAAYASGNAIAADAAPPTSADGKVIGERGDSRG